MARQSALPQGITLRNGRYRVRVFFDGKQHSLGSFDLLGDAKAALAIAQAEKARGQFVPPAERRSRLAAAREEQKADVTRAETESTTLGEWVTTWLDRMDARPDRSRATVVSYRSALNAHVLPRLGSTRLIDLRTEDIADLLDDVAALPSRRHPSVGHNGITPRLAIILRSCLNAAVRVQAGGLTSFEFPDVAKAVRVRPSEGDAEVATPADVTAFAEAMPPSLAIAVDLAAYCCLRIGEVLGLQRRDLLDLHDPTLARIRVDRQFNVKANRLSPPKAGSRRTIAIPEAMLPRLRTHLERYTGSEPTSPVLTDGKRLQVRVSQTKLDKEWRAARAKAGRPTFLFHGLRHTGLTLFAREGATLAELLARGGHTDVSVALRYQHATAERDRVLTAKLSKSIVAGERQAT